MSSRGIKWVGHECGNCQQSPNGPVVKSDLYLILISFTNIILFKGISTNVWGVLYLFWEKLHLHHTELAPCLLAVNHTKDSIDTKGDIFRASIKLLDYSYRLWNVAR